MGKNFLQVFGIDKRVRVYGTQIRWPKTPGISEHN